MTVAVFTDSAAGLPPEVTQEYDIAVVPVYLHMNGEQMRDGVDISPTRFYRLMTQGKQELSTSAPSVGDFLALYEQLRDAGATQIVGVLLSSGLSATFESAVQAKEMFSGPPVTLIDSGTVSMCTGYGALAAARAAKQGADADAVAAVGKDVCQRMTIRFTVETLEYLKRGGRIGPAAAWVGTLLQVAPILGIESGKIAPVARVRTRTRALNQIIEEAVMSASNRPVRIAVVHAAATDEAEAIAAQLRARTTCRELILSDLSPVLGAHAGPGTLGIGWYVDDDVAVVGG